jgi:hypothetical protein
MSLRSTRNIECADFACRGHYPQENNGGSRPLERRRKRGEPIATAGAADKRREPSRMLDSR